MKDLKVMNGRVLVRMDPDKEMVSSGLLVKPEGAHEHVLRTGEVVQVGLGKRSKKTDERLPMSLEKGEGVVFIRFLADTRTAESIQHHIGKDHVLLEEGDILLAYDRKEGTEFSQ